MTNTPTSSNPGSSRRLLVSLALGMVVVSGVSAGTAQTPPPPNKTFLWTISSKTATVDLLGSVHIATRGLYPLDARIETTFQRAHTLVLETSLDPASQMQAGQKLARAGTYPAGDSIDLHLDREVQELLQQRLKKSGSSFDQMRSFRPWFAAVILTLAEMQKLGYHPGLGIDSYFAGKAKDQKRIVALETIDEQVVLFSGMSDPIQGAMLKEVLTKLDDLGELMEKAQSSWRTGDARAVEDLMLAPMRREYPDVFQRLFVDRNRRMASAIEGYLRTTGEYFVVIGSGHLIGPQGILDLLQANGYVAIQQ